MRALRSWPFAARALSSSTVARLINVFCFTKSQRRKLRFALALVSPILWTATINGCGGDDSAAGTPVASNVIDDFEDGDAIILIQSGRNGPWYIIDDGTAAPNGSGTISPPANSFATAPLEAPRTNADGSTSKIGVHVRGGNFSSWGAGVGFNFRWGAAFYDASQYQGFTFYGKTGADPGITDKSFRVSITDADTDPSGRVCGVAPNGLCYDAHGTTFTLTPEWNQFKIAFSEMTQQGWGFQAPFDSTKVISLQVNLPGANMMPGVVHTWDLWIDDVAFYP